MFEIVKFNRFVQFTYPIIIILAALLTWNTAGQVQRFVDPRLPLLNRKLSPDSLAKASLSCSGKDLDSDDQQLCSVNSLTRHKLLDSIDRAERFQIEREQARPIIGKKDDLFSNEGFLN